MHIQNEHQLTPENHLCPSFWLVSYHNHFLLKFPELFVLHQNYLPVTSENKYTYCTKLKHDILNRVIHEEMCLIRHATCL